MNINFCSLRKSESCSKDDLVSDVARILRDKNVRNVLVLDDDKPIGIISVTDINNRVVAEGKDPKKTKAGEIMTRDLMVKDISDDLKPVYLDMLKKNIYSCAVIDKGKVKGMLDLKEAMNCIVKQKNKNGKGKK